MTPSEMALEVVTTPTENWLSEALKTCNSHFIVSSPCVGEALLRLAKLIPAGTSFTLITSINLYNFRVGASNINSLYELGEMGVRVLSIDHLYARIFIIDDTKALVTSANATSKGLNKNIECGVATTDSECVKELSELVLGGFGDENSLLEVSLDDLNDIKKSLPLLQGTISTVNDSLQDAAYDSISKHMLEVTDPNEFINFYSGWLHLTLNGILDMKEFFTLQELCVVSEEARKKAFLSTDSLEDDLKKQLQRLGDMGLIEPVRNDKYRKLVTFQREFSNVP